MLPKLRGDLTDLYADVAEAAPKARIVVTGYPHLFEPVPRSVALHAINAAIDQLNATIRDAVSVTQDADVNIHYVDVIAEFAGHGIGSTDAFHQPPVPPNDEAFHPTADGYKAYADAISAALPGGWVKPFV